MASGDKSNKIEIRLESGRCLRARSVWAGCQLCVDSCPGQAIQIRGKDRVPSVDLRRCMQCGQCLSACPLDAFQSASFSERRLLERVEGKEPIRLKCFLSFKGKVFSEDQGQTYRLGTCLAALSVGALVELAFDRPCVLATDHCAECPFYGRLSKTFEYNLVYARRMLADWGRAVHLQESVPLVAAPCVRSLFPVRYADEDAPVLTAEAQADKVRYGIRSLFHSRRQQERLQEGLLPLRAKSRHVPFWRKRLQEVWEKREGCMGQAYPWPVLSVDAFACKACGMCMQLCPTGSIRHMLHGGRFAYLHTPGTCTNCGLCIEACPAGALIRAYELQKRPFSAMVRLERPARACSRCGLPVLGDAMHEEPSLCRLCLSEPDPKTLIERVRKQMAAGSVSKGKE